MYRIIGGINTYDSAPGYKKIKIMPHVGGGLTNATTTYQSNYGLISSNWLSKGGRFQLDVQIPANTTAVVYIPAPNVESVIESSKLVSESKDVKLIGKEGNFVVVELGSGKYSFLSVVPKE
jgi:alpha-L-rhamnosidase